MADICPRYAIITDPRRPYILSVYITSPGRWACTVHLHPCVCIPESSSILVRKFHAALLGRLGDHVAPFPDWIPRD